MADGTLVFSTKLLAEGFKAGVEKINEGLGGLKGKLTSLSKAIGAVFGVNWFVSAVKGINQFSAEFRDITEQFQPFIESAAEVNAANSQMEQTFGSFLDSAKAAIGRVADTSNILETRLNGVGTSIYAFAQTAGMDSVTALNMMEEALQITADSAAYYDRSLEETAESLKSFLKGNFENDAALGLSATEFTRNAAANKLYGKSIHRTFGGSETAYAAANGQGRKRSFGRGRTGGARILRLGKCHGKSHRGVAATACDRWSADFGSCGKRGSTHDDGGRNADEMGKCGGKRVV